MAKIYGKPSHYLRERSMHFMNKATLMAFGGLAIIYLLSQSVTSYPSRLIGFIVSYTLIAIAAVLVYKFYKEDDRISENYYRGRMGEKEIFEELSKLPDEFRVFCDVSIHPPYNIDFVVLGPTGIYTIEAKSHQGEVWYTGGKITINGSIPEEKDFLRQSKAEALSVNAFLKDKTGNDHFVIPVLAFSRATMRFGLHPLDGVYVIGRGFLLQLLRTVRKQSYSEEKLSELEAVLRPLAKQDV